MLIFFIHIIDTIYMWIIVIFARYKEIAKDEQPIRIMGITKKASRTVIVCTKIDKQTH